MVIAFHSSEQFDYQRRRKYFHSFIFQHKNVDVSSTQLPPPFIDGACPDLRHHLRNGAQHRESPPWEFRVMKTWVLSNRFDRMTNKHRLHRQLPSRRNRFSRTKNRNRLLVPDIRWPVEWVLTRYWHKVLYIRRWIVSSCNPRNNQDIDHLFRPYHLLKVVIFERRVGVAERLYRSVDQEKI